MKLGALLPHKTRFAGVTLGRDRVALRLLSDYLAGTFDVDFGGSDEVARLHQDFIIDLVALALGTEGDTRAQAEQRGAQAVRRAAVVQAIAASMADPALDATMVAARAWNYSSLRPPSVGADGADLFRTSARQAVGASYRAVVRARTTSPQDCGYRLRGWLQGSVLFQSDVSTQIRRNTFGHAPGRRRRARAALTAAR